MTLSNAITLGSMASVVLTALGLGLSATLGEATYLFRHPRRFVRALVTIDVVMPLFVLAVLALTHLPPAIRIALAALSVSPVSPSLPAQAMKAGGRRQYAVALLVGVSLIAVVFVPLGVELLGTIRGVETHISVSTVAFLMTATVFGPLVAGIAIRRFAAVLAERASGSVSACANILLLVSQAAVLPGALASIWSLMDDGAFAAVVAFVAFGFAVGHLAGGPDPEDRVSLAIGAASRHPGVAMAIATSSFPDERLVLPAMLLYLLASRLVLLPYFRWRRRQPRESAKTLVRPRSN